MPTAEPADQLAGEADRLGDLVNGHPEHVDEVLPQLVRILTSTDASRVLLACIAALGHAWHPAAAAALLDHVRPDHPDPQVRLALAQALPGGIDTPGDLRDRTIDALILLTADAEPHVRDWAAFGLGQLQARSPSAREALAGLLHDPDHDARCEALQALAAAGDDRAHPVLLARLDASGDLCLVELEAAAALAAPDLHPGLQRLAEEWAGDADEFTQTLELALSRCHPDAAALAGQVEQNLLEIVRGVVQEPAGVQLQGAYPRTALIITRDGDPEVHLDVWADGEDPTDYPVTHVVGAVLGALAPPEP
ncbi:HEAT repeat protein [Kineococcus xinjiangensis]|uniref:HEAT repeat protein n=1 Tax=Kineococcus xinjiangensis TaxID=512762 RepID=A0A2S6IPT5_9ACTN|nr:HEAT repeat domain-containing protein [Kineococcus xinjiangensis]PPK96185.1 HEAT repeat protein [Kineococcus xinjiangensis]